MTVNTTSIGEINSYSVIYEAEPATWDVTGVSTLTFLLLDSKNVPVQLPTIQPFPMKLNLIRVIV